MRGGDFELGWKFRRLEKVGECRGGGWGRRGERRCYNRHRKGRLDEGQREDFKWGGKFRRQEKGG